MGRIIQSWIARCESKKLDSFLLLRAWHWLREGNFALTADYVIRYLNRHPRDPLALIMGEVSGRFTKQDEFVAKCEEAKKRLCFIKDIDNPFDLIPDSAQRAVLDEYYADSIAQQSENGECAILERMVVKEQETNEETKKNVLTASLRAQGTPFCELLEPSESIHGRGLYATCMIPPGSAILVDEPTFVQRYDHLHCSHCLAPLKQDIRVPNPLKVAEVFPCPHCPLESYCSVSCQNAAWTQYHSCSCGSVNPKFTQWQMELMEQNLSGKTLDHVSIDGAAARASLRCLAIAKICAVATIQQKHPLSLNGIRHLRGRVDYDPTIALGEVGALSVLLASFFRQDHLYMEEILSLFAIWQTNEFIVPGGSALYPILSLLNHSCDPNCALVPASSCGMGKGSVPHCRVLSALRTIRDGEHLTINYNSNLTNKLTYEQRKELCAQRHFECFCVKCVQQI